MKIVIFGGGGFIGSTIADRLLMDGHQIKIFERPRVKPYREFGEDEQVEWLAGDLSSIYDIRQAIYGVDAVLHLVSTTLPKSSNDDPIYDVKSNVIATLQLLESMVELEIPKIIFISSGGTVYGSPIYLPIDEKHPTNPLVSYGITKLTIEKYLQMYSCLNGIQAIALRVANPYGERQRPETAQGAIGVFIHHALSGIPIEIWGDGNVTRDYLHVSDVAEAFVTALKYSGAHRIFNISSNSGVNLKDIIKTIEILLGEAVKVSYMPARKFDVPISILNNTLAREELSWSPSISLFDGIARTIDWMKINLDINR